MRRRQKVTSGTALCIPSQKFVIPIATKKMLVLEMQIKAEADPWLRSG
jgi:hypothetical protein